MAKKIRLVIGADHSAVALKAVIKAHLERQDIAVLDVGTFTDAATDYPVIAQTVAVAIQAKEADVGILMCGTGIGMSISANKFKGIRAAAVSDPFSASLAKQHNDANVLCFGARIVGEEMAKAITDAFIQADFLGGRHDSRVKIIQSFES